MLFGSQNTLPTYFALIPCAFLNHFCSISFAQILRIDAFPFTFHSLVLSLSLSLSSPSASQDVVRMPRKLVDEIDSAPSRSGLPTKRVTRH